jgi:microcystin-dependent protein
MHWGTGPSGFNTSIGEVQGTSTVTLTTQQIPQHNHVITAAEPGQGATAERVAVPTNTSFLGNNSNRNLGWNNPPANLSAQFAPNAITMTGAGLPHENMQPYLTINFLIALYGIFPTRN